MLRIHRLVARGLVVDGLTQVYFNILRLVFRLLGIRRLNKETFRYLLNLNNLNASVQPSFARKLADQGRTIDCPCLINLTNADLLQRPLRQLPTKQSISCRYLVDILQIPSISFDC